MDLYCHCALHGAQFTEFNIMGLPYPNYCLTNYTNCTCTALKIFQKGYLRTQGQLLSCFPLQIGLQNVQELAKLETFHRN